MDYGAVLGTRQNPYHENRLYCQWNTIIVAQSGPDIMGTQMEGKKDQDRE